MRGYLIAVEALGKLAGHPLHQATRIDENQGRPMRLDQLGQPVIDLLPDFARHDRFERRGRDFESEVARPAVAGIDNLTLGIGSNQRTRDRGPSQSAARRSSDSAKCEPRLLGASAWISSTITVRVVASILRPESEPSRMYSDSGVVTTMCGGARPMR